MIKAYRKGADYEREIVKDAKDAGLIAFRSAGSHSPIDVCIIDLKTRKITFLQCKRGKFRESEKKRIREMYHGLNQVFQVNFDIAHKEDYDFTIG